MYTTSAEMKHIRLRLHTVNGNVSAYFLSVFLLAVTVCAAFAAMMQQRFASILFLEKAQKYQIAEMQVIQALKCALRTDAVSISSSENTIFDMELASGTAYATISWPVREAMTIVYDEQTGRVFDFHAERMDADS